MAVSANATLLTNLVNPEVMADLVNAKLTDAIKFAPLAKVDKTLVGVPGNTIKVPVYAYIGKAVTVGEGQSITISQLTATSTPATIAKVGTGVELTDEAVLSGYGDPLGEAVKQITLSIADAIDDSIKTALVSGATAHSVATSGSVSADDIADALTKFGEDIDGAKVLLISATDYATIRKASNWIPGTDVGAEIIVRGVVGMIHGCQVVVSNRVTAGTAFIVKPGALTLYLKRDVLVESDRDIVNKSTVITADEHYVAVVSDASKAIYLS